MAGDWIKMREDLHEDPAILSIARQLGTRPEHVVGYCHKFWSWVSRNCPDGVLRGLVLDDIGSVLALPGFPQLLVSVGWLEYDDSHEQPVIRIPKFDRHLSQGAKHRALEAERKRLARVLDQSGKRPQKLGRNVGPEKRREEILSLRKKESKKAFDPLAVELPFSSDGFRAAWSDWAEHRKEIREPLTAKAVSAQLKKLASMGEPRAIAALEHSTAGSYQGIFEPNREPARNGRPEQPPREPLSAIAKRQRGES